MLEHAPTRESLARLVHAALRVRAATPWRRIHDDQYFGVRDPRTGTLGLVAVSGHAGGSRGISVYPGVTGYATLVRGTHGLIPDERFEALREMHSLGCGFMPWADLTADDRRLLKDSGLTVTVDKEVPHFMCFRPGYLPSPPDAAEAEYLATVLEQTLEVVRELPGDDRPLAGRTPGTYRTRVLTTKNGIASWGWAWADIDEVRGFRQEPWVPDELMATRLRRLPMTPEEEWEVAAVAGAGILRETSRARPELLLAMLMVERRTGRIVSADALRAPRLATEVGPWLAKRLLTLGTYPHRFLVREYELRDLLAPVVKPLGSKLLRVQHLPALEVASEDMLDHLARGLPH